MNNRRNLKISIAALLQLLAKPVLSAVLYLGILSVVLDHIRVSSQEEPDPYSTMAHCAGASEGDNPSPEELHLMALDADDEDMEPGSENECDGHENILEEELLEVMTSPVQSFASTIAHSGPLNKLQSICQQIYKDVTRFPRLGSPGNLVVFGDNALPVASTSSGHGVFMAVAEVGEGRVAFMTSNKMVDGILTGKGKGQFAIMHENVMQWILKTRVEKPRYQVLELSTVEHLDEIDKGSNVVVSLNYTNTLDRHTEILDYVKNGGGFIAAKNPSHWSDNSEELQNTGHPFFTEIGIGITMDKVFIPGKDHVIDLKEEFYQTLLASHIGHWVTSCINTPVDQYPTLAKSIRNALGDIPRYALESNSDKLTALFDKAFDHMGGIGPNSGNAIKSPSKCAAAGICGILLNKGVGPEKAPAVAFFPGDIRVEPLPLECVEIKIKPRTSRKETYPTGYYLPPGKHLILTVTNKRALSEGWSVKIGAHSDSLFKKSPLKRWPLITVKKSISRGKKLHIHSPYGGSIYIHAPDNSSEEVAEVILENVVETPYFNLDDEWTMKNWDANGRKSPGKWADVCGKHIRFTVPSFSVMNMSAEEMKDVMETWDRVMLCHLELRGTDPQKFRKEWIVYDIQISKGSMHSGYPIMGHLKKSTDPNSEKFVLSKERLTTTGAWGPYHELGHNMQRSSWTFKGMREVTCNIFALHAIDVVAGKPVFEHSKMNDPSRLERFAKHFAKGAPFKEWQSSLPLALAFYGHLAHTFGWDTYKKVFSEYEAIPKDDHPRSNENKIDQWLIRFSRNAGYDIGPIMDLWGVKFSDYAHKQVEQPAYLPDDKITQLVPEWADKVAAKYPSIIRTL